MEFPRNLVSEYGSPNNLRISRLELFVFTLWQVRGEAIIIISRNRYSCKLDDYRRGIVSYFRHRKLSDHWIFLARSSQQHKNGRLKRWDARQHPELYNAVCSRRPRSTCIFRFWSRSGLLSQLLRFSRDVWLRTSSTESAFHSASTAVSLWPRPIHRLSFSSHTFCRCHWWFSAILALSTHCVRR